MNLLKSARVALAATASVAFTLTLAVRAQAQTQSVIYSFPGGYAGNYAWGGAYELSPTSATH